MTPGGPETALATGEMPAIDEAVAEANAVPTDPTQSTTAPQVDPTGAYTPSAAAQQPARADVSYRIGVRPPDFGGRQLSNSDFVPHPDPRLIQHGQHAFSMPAFQLGAAAIGARMANINRGLADNKAAQQALVQQGQEKTVPAPYLQSYHEFGQRIIDDFVKGWAKRLGSEDKAWRAINEDPVVRRQFQRVMQQYGDVGEILNYDFKEAEKYIDDVRSGKRRYDKNAYDSAVALKKGLGGLGMGGYGDLQQLLNLRNNYQFATTLPHYLENSGIDKHVKDFMAQTFRDEQGNSTFRMDKKGGITVFSHEDRKTAEKMIDNLVDSEYPQFMDLYPNKEDFSRALHQWYPVQEELKIDKVVPPPRPSGKGESGATADGKVGMATGLSPVSRVVADPERAKAQMGPLSQDVPTISPSEATGGKFKQLAPRTFDGPRGQVTIVAPELKFIDGSWKVVGSNLNAEEIATMQGIEAKSGANSAELDKYLSKVTEGRMEYLDASKNMTRLKSYFGNDFSIEKMVSDKAASHGYPWDQAAFDRLPKEKRQAVMTMLFKD